MTILFAISFGEKHLAQITHFDRSNWQDIAARLTRKPPETTDKASPGWFCCAEFEPGYRDSENLIARSALTFDYDKITAADIVAIKAALISYEYLIYTTWSHTNDNPRLRVILPLSRPATPDEFCAVSRKIAEKAGIERAARESHVPAQMMFLPSVKPGEKFTFKVHLGEFVDVDKTLAEYADWTDRKQWPHRKESDGTYKPGELPIDPREKPGIIGAFCRAFDIPTAIDKFGLPYEKTNTENRYTYTKGSRPEGVVIYDEGQKCHSHHDTDPAHGQTNAFDLVRLHHFGHFDKDQTVLGDAHKPSFRAMVAFANEIPEVKVALAAKEFDPVSDVEQEAVDVSGVTDKGISEASKTDSEKHSEQFPVPQAVAKPPKFRVIPAQDFATDIPLQWHIKGVLPHGELAVLYGESGSGKSFMALDLAACISRGVSWRDKIVQKGRVVYVAAEGAGGFRQRLRAYAQRHEVPLADLPGIVGDAPNLLEMADSKALTVEILKYGGADLVIVDTLARTMPAGNENASEDMSRIISHCKAIHRATGALVMAVHHSGKDTTKGARGHSSLRAAADAELEVARNGDFRALTIRKMKDGSDSAQWAFKLDVVDLGFDKDGDEITSCVVLPVEGAIRIGLKEPKGALQKSALSKVKMSESQVDVTTLLDTLVAEMPVDRSKRDQRRSTAMHAVEGLVADKFLQVESNGFLSVTKDF